MPPSSPLTLTFLLFDGFSTMVLASAIEPLRAACDLSGQPLFRWRIATPDGAEAVSSSGLRLRPDGGEGDDPAADARRGLVVIAGYGVRRHHRSRTLRLVLRLARGAEPVAGFDTGAWLLAGAGLLDGRRATLHWMERESFAEAFPAVDTVAGRHVADGPFVTAGSAEGVLDWSLDLIGKQAGEALRFDVGTMFGRSSGKPVPTPGEVAPGAAGVALPVALQRAVVAMRRTIEAPVPMASIAAAAAVSPRTLERLFASVMGQPAGRYYRNLRLAHARTLATETRLGLNDIAARTGFSSAATLARAYRGRFGQTVAASRPPR